MGEASAVSVCGCGCGLCRKVHFKPKDPFPSYPAQGPNSRTKKNRFQGKESRLSVPVISLLPKPQTPLKSPGPHGCCGGGDGEWVLGGAWGCGSALPGAERCGAVPGAGAVRLPVRAGWGVRSTWAVPTPFCFPTTEPKTLSSLSSWFQGPPRDALIGWGGCPRPRQSPREGEGSRGGSPARAPPRPARPPRTRTRTGPGSGGVSTRGERARGAALLHGAAASFHPRSFSKRILTDSGPSGLCVQGV